MKILSMTATFGKLENQTLKLHSGMNIIEAPNEWGKSTWCAFIVTMLYGLDTRAKSTKTALSDKEHYAPWSGSPMSGRMDLEWNGRNITIERYTKGRTPMGEFRAYETETGLPVSQLTGANCGFCLLGVERSVFLRAGFLRSSDLSVTNDEALRHRLNALVTTGDESQTALLLGQKLKELKNRCRYHNSGLLPQAEARRKELERQLEEQQALTRQCGKLQQRLNELEQWSAALHNHKAALHYAAAQKDARQVAQAQDTRNAAHQRLQEMEQQCNSLPSRQDAERNLHRLRELQQEWDSLQMEEGMLPSAPVPLVIPDAFHGKTPDEAIAQAEADRRTALSIPTKTPVFPLLLMVLGILCCIGAAVLLPMQQWIAVAVLVCVGCGLSLWGFLQHRSVVSKTAALRNEIQGLCRRYGSEDPDYWVTKAQQYRCDLENYREKTSACRRLRGNLDQRKEELRQKLAALTDTGSPSLHTEHWQQIIASWDALTDAARDYRQADGHLNALQAMAKTARPPANADTLTYTDAETDRLISDVSAQIRQIHTRLGQYQGRSEASGNLETLQKELDRLNRRIQDLQHTHRALEIAEQTLIEAKQELQRRFAPQLTQQARSYFSRLTGGRYDRMTLADDLTIRTAAEGETTLRPHPWRSDGTVDQLYLALRLAVAKSLTPHTPLILDDALMRFDDTRLAAAMQLLCDEAGSRQIILFSCHHREQRFSPL